MKNLTLFLLITALTSFNALANETVKFAIGEWVPYTSKIDMKGNLLEKIVTEAFKLEGVDVIYEYFPWKRSYNNVKNGQYDATFPWNKTEERKKDFYINKLSLIKDEGVFFHLKRKQFDWNSVEDLKKYKVGVTISFKQEKIYKDKGIKAHPVASEDFNFKMMLADRIDVYETSKVVGYAMINKLFSPEEAKLFTNHPKAVEENVFYILFSRKTPDGKYFADKFDSGLKKLKESGVYDIILDEYTSVANSR